MKVLTAIRILVAHYRFSCPLCGRVVHKGDNYVDEEGVSLCVHCGLPHEH
jgi:predicted RNA-binding Zn-ribbon protein involved in translation (DUF1610 family)